MIRPLLWLLPAVVLFAALVLLIAPGALASRALLLGAAAVVPGTIALLVAVGARRRRGPDRPADRPPEDS